MEHSSDSSAPIDITLKGKKSDFWRRSTSSLIVPRSIDERHILKRAAQAGAITREDRGLYLVNEDLRSSHHNLAAIGIRNPNFIIALGSAAYFHGLTSNEPEGIQIYLPRGVHPPRWKYPVIEPIHVLPEMLSMGVKEHDIEGVTVKICSPERLLSDCLYFKNRVDQNSFQEILWGAWRKKSFSIDTLIETSTYFGVGKEMKMYIQTMQGA